VRAECSPYMIISELSIFILYIVVGIIIDYKDIYSLSCPFPLVLADHPTDEGNLINIIPFLTFFFSPSDSPCEVPCPDPTWNSHQWKSLADLLFACSTVGGVLMFLLCVHYITYPGYRNSINRFQLYAVLRSECKVKRKSLQSHLVH
jgi:hypothetical protein